MIAEVTHAKSLVTQANTVFVPGRESGLKRLTSGVIIMDVDTQEVLKIKRGPNNTSHAGEWSIPGGGAEPGETPRQAAVRETGQEVGYIFSGAALVHAYTKAKPKKEKRYEYFVVGIEGKFTPDLSYDDGGYQEHTEALWCRPDISPDNNEQRRIANLFAELGNDKILELALHSLSKRLFLSRAKDAHEAKLLLQLP